MHLRSRRGFTLIELLVVMVVISILAAFGITNFQKARIHAQAAALSHDLSVLEDELIEAYVTGMYTGDAPPTSLEELGALLPEGTTGVRLPEDMSVAINGTRGGSAIAILLRTDPSHTDIIEALGEMRPLTTRVLAPFLTVEEIDLEGLAVKQLGAPAGGSN